MFQPFFQNLRDAGLPVSLREYLTFLEGMGRNLVTYDVEGFYYLARAAMVKDERMIDRFDRAFAASFEGLESISVEHVLEAVDLPPKASISAFSSSERCFSAISVEHVLEAVDLPQEWLEKMA
ncbi:MAG: hypothetical protein AAFO72_09005, partial [Pseudomonadota bacterium]